MAPFTAAAPPATPAQQPLDYSGIQRALQNFTEMSLRRDERRADEAAALAQQEMGVVGIAEPERRMLPRIRQAFDARARAVYDQQLRTDAFQTASRLTRENHLNPAGFASAWEEYTEGTSKAVAQSDPNLAVEVQNYLNQVGAQAAMQLEQNVFDRELQTQGVEVQRAINDQLIAARDMLLNNPSEELFEAQRTEIAVSLTEADGAGVLSPRELFAIESRINDDLASDLVNGYWHRAMEEDDTATLQTLVNDLRKGRWFDDNAKALSMADRIERSVGGNISRYEINSRLEIGRRMLGVVQAGGELTPEMLSELDAHYQFVQAVGEPQDLDTMTELYRGVNLVAELSPVIGNVNAADLNTLADALVNFEQVRAIDAGAVSFALKAVNDEISRRRDAQSAGDLAALGTSTWRNTSFFDMLSADEATQSAAFASLAENRTAAASQTLAPVQLHPFWTHEQTEEAVAAISNAIDQGDPQLADRAAKLFLAPYFETGNVMAGARQLATISPEIGGAVLGAEILSGVNGTAAATWLQLSIAGENIRKDPANAAAFAKLATGMSANREKIFALANGDSVMYNALAHSIENILVGMYPAGIEPSNARREISNLLGQIDTIELRNGTMMLSRDLGETREMQRAAADLINGWMREARRTHSLLDIENVRPVPIGDGQFHLKNELTNMLIREPGSAQPLRLSLEPDAYAEIIERGQSVIENQAQAANARMENRLELANSDQDAFRVVGRKAGLSDEQWQRYHRAITASPATSLAQLPNGISPEVYGGPMSESDYSAQAREFLRDASRVTRRRATNVSYQRLGTMLLYADMIKEYNGDEAKALAALASSRSAVEAAENLAGDEWFDALDIHTRTFVERGFQIR